MTSDPSHCEPPDPPGGLTAGLAEELRREVAERRRAEEELRLRDRAISAVSQGILIADPNLPDHPIVYASPGFERLTGYAPAEAVGRNCRFLQGPGTDPAAVAEVRAAIRDGHACTVELLNYRKDGSTFWNALALAPVRDEVGRLVHVVGTQIDVTERRKLEDQLRQSQKLEAVGRLAGGIAHDFNNLLTVINGYSEILLSGLGLRDLFREPLEQIRMAGERAAGLTRQLLAFSRKQVLAPEILDPNALLQNLEKMLSRLIGEDVNLRVVTAPGVGMVKVDRGQMEQVVMNLVVNARDAMPRGGKLTVETRDVELDEGFAAAHPETPPGAYVLVAVSDTGAGMSADVKAKIFDPFFSTKGEHGTGLGLAVVHGIVQQSGGRVDVYSELGIGTTFKVYLPRAGGVPTPKKPPATAATRRGTERILLVEDEGGVRSLTRLMLERYGYTVTEARNGREALEACRTPGAALDLVVTDMVMPDMSGWELARQLAAVRPGLKVLYLSGYTDDAVVRHGMLTPETPFLQKPFTPDALAVKVREVLG